MHCLVLFFKADEGEAGYVEERQEVTDIAANLVSFLKLKHPMQIILFY